jgi:hypothetical protein
MTFDDIYPVTDRLNPSTREEIATAEASIGTPFPPGYSEFVTKFGEGTISNWVRVYPPARVADEHAGLRERREEYFFWDEGSDVLDRSQVAESMLIADTLNGDEVVYHAQDPVGFFALPNDDGNIHSIGATLTEAIDWLCTSGTLTGALGLKSFEPIEGRERKRFEAESDGPNYETARDALLALGLHGKSNDATEGDDVCFDLFIREFGGVVTIVEGDHGAIVGIRSNAGADGSKWRRLLGELASLGLVETDR